MTRVLHPALPYGNRRLWCAALRPQRLDAADHVVKSTETTIVRTETLYHWSCAQSTVLIIFDGGK